MAQAEQRPHSGRVAVVRELFNALVIGLGIMSAAMGLKGFLLSSSFIDGGVTGISMLLAKTTAVPLAGWLPIMKLPFGLVGYRPIGAAFALRRALGDGGLAAVLAPGPVPEGT